MKTNTMTCYQKEGRDWVETYKTDDPTIVYEMLASNLMYKYKFNSGSIRRIDDRPDYGTGNRIITVYEGSDYKRVYDVNV